MDATGAPGSPAGRVVLAAAATVVVLAGLREAASVVAPAMIALLLAVAVVPLQRRLVPRVGRLPAYLLTLAIVLAAILALVGLIAAGVAGFGDALPRYAGNTESVSQEANRLLVPSGVRVEEVVAMARERTGDDTRLALEAAEGALEAISGFGLVVLLAAFMLADALALREKTIALDRMTEDAVARLRRVTADIRSYLKITGAVGVVTGLLCMAVFFVAGVDFSILWGLLIIVLSFVPVLGFWGAVVPPSLLAALERGLGGGIAVAAACVLIHAATSNVIKPKLLSDGLNLSAFTVIFSVVFWTFVLGPLGALLAVPLTLVVKGLILDDDPGVGWLAVLMGRRLGERDLGSVSGHSAGRS